MRFLVKNISYKNGLLVSREYLLGNFRNKLGKWDYFAYWFGIDGILNQGDFRTGSGRFSSDWFQCCTCVIGKVDVFGTLIHAAPRDNVDAYLEESMRDLRKLISFEEKEFEIIVIAEESPWINLPTRYSYKRILAPDLFEVNFNSVSGEIAINDDEEVFLFRTPLLF